MDSVTLLEESQRTFLRAPDVLKYPSLDPAGIQEARKCIDFDEFVDDENEKIRVYARLKPRLRHEEEDTSQSEFYSRISINEGREIITNPSSLGTPSQRFLFNEIFDSQVGQSEFFSRMVLPRIKDFLLLGTHQLVFTYGASSSGKTFTVQGTPSQPGILPRSLDVIFNSLGYDKLVEKSPIQPSGFDAATSSLSSYEALKEEKESVLALGRYLLQEEVGEEQSSMGSSSSIGFSNLSLREKEEAKIEGLENEGMYYSLWVSFAEIYNENIYDLFEKLPPPSKKLRVIQSRKTPLKLCEDRKGTAYIKGLKEIFVSSADEAYQLLLIGRKNLQFAATKLNHNSSRSHCIFTIKVVRFCDLNQPQFGKVNILSFCDLAGSERMKKTNNVGTRRIEAGNINSSLLVLSRVMKTLRDNQRTRDVKKHAIVPFRDSKLTRLFQAFFIGYGKASMIVNLSQSSYLFDETLQALKFAAITSKINYAKEIAPAKPKRKSRFSTILFQHKRTSALTGRNTILWENPEARSTLCPQNQEEDEEDEEESDVDECNDTRYDALTNLIADLEQRLAEEKRKNTSLESDIRTELCNEFNIMMVNTEKEWQKRLKDTTERMDELSDWRIQKLENAYKLNRKRKRHEIGDDELRDKIADLESKLEGRELELEDNNKQIAAIKETHKSLVDARNKLQEELTALKFTNEDQKSKLKTMEKEMNKLTLESKSKDTATTESLSLKPMVEDLKEQLSDKTEKVAYLKKLLDEAGEEFLSKEENETKLNMELGALKAELANLKMALSDAQEENAVLIKEANHKQEDYESIEELLTICRKENAQLLRENKRILSEWSKSKERNSNDDEDDTHQLKNSSEIKNLRSRLDSTSEEVDGLLKELNKTRKLYEDQEKLFKKVEDEKNRLEKDLNDEIENLRRSKIQIKSSEDEKKKKLVDKDKEIKNLEKEIKCLLKDIRTKQESLQDKDGEIVELQKAIKKQLEEVSDTQVLGKKIAEQQAVIDNLEAQVKSSEQEDSVIAILKNELKLKNSEKSQLLSKISKLEDQAASLSELTKLQETVAYLESEIEAKNYEVNKTREEGEIIKVRYNKLIKCKEEELCREKQETLKLRDVMRSVTPSKKSSLSHLEEEMAKKDTMIKELEERLQKSLCDGEVEDLLRDEIESLKRAITGSQEKHSKELHKIKKAHEKVINEYKEANKELQKQVGISTIRENEGDSSPSQATSPMDGDESVSNALVDSSVQSSVKRTRRRVRNGSKAQSSLSDKSNLENEEESGESFFDSENIQNSTRKSHRVTRSRPVHKTKKKHVSYIDRNAAAKTEVKRLSVSEQPDVVDTPRRSKRIPYQGSGQIEALSPLENIDDSWEASRQSGKRQLRTRKKK